MIKFLRKFLLAIPVNFTLMANWTGVSVRGVTERKELRISTITILAIIMVSLFRSEDGNHNDYFVLGRTMATQC